MKKEQYSGIESESKIIVEPGVEGLKIVREKLKQKRNYFQFLIGKNKLMDELNFFII